MKQEMVLLMPIKNKIFTALLMLFVLTGQAITADDFNSCDMGMTSMHMSQGTMDCCNDEANCDMDCALSMVLILNEAPSFESRLATFEHIAISSPANRFGNSLSSLFRPPIIL